MNDRALVWINDNGLVGPNTRQLAVSAASTHPGVAIDQISIVFELDGPASVALDPNGVTLNLIKATDASGAPLAGVTLTNQGIF